MQGVSDARPSQSTTMKILGLDSATVACSAAICVDGVLRARRYDQMTRGQSEVLMPMVEGVFEDAGLEAGDLDLIAVTVGPGAFTGLRIAIATALGLSLASDVRAAGVTTMEALAYGARSESPQLKTIIVALDSRRDDIYLQVFSDEGQPVGDVEAVATDDLTAWYSTIQIKSPVTLIGDAADRAVGFFDSGKVPVQRGAASSIPDAGHIAALATEKLQAALPMRELRPLYLRPPDAVVPKNGGRLRP